MITPRPTYFAGLEVVEDVAQLGERAGAADVTLHLARRGHVDELAHVLHGADGRVDQRRIALEELEGIELEVPLARRGQADRDEEAAASQHLQTEIEAGQLGREHETRVDAAELLHRLDCILGADRAVCAWTTTTGEFRADSAFREEVLACAV